MRAGGDLEFQEFVRIVLDTFLLVDENHTQSLLTLCQATSKHFFHMHANAAFSCRFGTFAIFGVEGKRTLLELHSAIRLFECCVFLSYFSVTGPFFYV